MKFNLPLFRPPSSLPLSPKPSPPTGEPRKRRSIDLGDILIVLGAGYAAYRIYQHATDEELGDRFYSKEARRELIDEHCDRYGSTCPECGDWVTESELHIDHKIPYSLGGRTSRHNAQIRCRSCNSRKGANPSLLDRLFGMSV